MDRIELRGIRGWGHHGVLERERTDGQPFIADIGMAVALAPAAASDELADTVDYDAVATLVHERLEGEPRDLVEALAGDIADAVLAHDTRIESVTVTLHKPEAPVQVTVEDVVVTIHRARS